MKLVVSIFLALFAASSIGVLASQSVSDEPGMHGSKLELSVRAAIVAAKKCEANVDELDMRVSLVGALYKVEFSSTRKRGGGAVVTLNRATSKVESVTCLQ